MTDKPQDDLEKLVYAIKNDGALNGHKTSNEPWVLQILALVLQTVEEKVIGGAVTHDLGTFTQDELDKLENAAIYAVAQDQLRAEMRKKLKELRD